ncbi:diguanylate cyclase [Pseudoduganella sp. FT93W]|uniref:diguanylate cyclase n=1 Tax=Duganella fentianensis TaxID=2692177 RepID=A0A845I203_9BURK|nr:GGDEF domain-containing protein [Duganella fentianensis]MYN45126.1 diguanylate cyclase [Duganella fentianensis]
MPHQRRPQVRPCATWLCVTVLLGVCSLAIPAGAGELLPKRLPVREYLHELRQQLTEKSTPQRRQWRNGDSLRLPIPAAPDNAAGLVPRQPMQPRAHLAQRPATATWPDASSSIFERYWWQILLGGSLIILQGLLISALILALRSRRLTLDALHDERNQLEARVLQRTQELMQANAKLEQLATTDPLTGIGNRRRMTEQINRELDRGRRFGHPLSLLMADIDHFKNVNDQYGHEAGDRVIVAVAKALADGVRNIDMASRFGGEEFVLLMPETSIEVATSAAERLRQEIAALEVKGDKGESIHFTISIGVAMAPPDNTTDTPSTLVSRADKALYQAKDAGRNRVVSSG